MKLQKKKNIPSFSPHRRKVKEVPHGRAPPGNCTSGASAAASAAAAAGGGTGVTRFFRMILQIT